MKHSATSIILLTAVITTSCLPVKAKSKKPDPQNQTIGQSESNNENEPLEVLVESLIERVDELELKLQETKTQLAEMEENYSIAGGRIVQLENKTAPIVNDVIDGQPAFVIQGVNVYIQNNQGEIANGKGNLILGYNTSTEGEVEERTGSHNLIVGPGHSYSGRSSVLLGINNTDDGHHNAILGGYQNSTGFLSTGSVIVSGRGNQVTTVESVIVAGVENAAAGPFSAILGGRGNQAHATSSAIVGGYMNFANGTESSVLGGIGCSANAQRSSVGGGFATQSNVTNEFTY